MICAALLLSCIIETTPEQRRKYEAVCIKEVAGNNPPAIMLKVHEMRINACIVAKDRTAWQQTALPYFKKVVDK